MLIDYNGKIREMTNEEIEEFNQKEEKTPIYPTAEEILEAQVIYTALLTDTLLK